MEHGRRTEMNEEDEAFNEIERQAKQRKEAVRKSLSGLAIYIREMKK